MEGGGVDRSGAAAEGSLRAKRAVFVTALIAGIGGLLFGYDTGIIAGALLFIRSDFDLDSLEQGLVVSAVPIGAAAGAVLASRLSDRHGRRPTVLVAAAVFVLGSAVSAAAPGPTVLVAARAVIGVAIGLASATAPVYVSEIAPPESRGRLVSLFQLSVTVGILVAYLVGLAFDPIDGWRWMLGLGIVPAVALGIGMLRMPTSPRWLVMAGRGYAARAVLERIRADDQAAIDRELEQIEAGLSEQAGGWRELATPVVRAALLIGVGLAVLQQVTGINTVIYYAPTIIEFTGIDGSSSAILAAVGVGIVNVGMTVVALWVLDRVGRRPLLIGGASVMSLALAALGIAFLGSDEDTFSSVVAVGGLMIYVGAFAISLGPIFWLMNAEIYSQRVRSKAASVGVTANWLANFVVSLTFLLLIDALGRSGAFWLYAGIGVVTVVFCWRLVPETRGRRLEDIQAIFRARVERAEHA